MNCVCYARVSSQEQGDGYSIDAQLNSIRTYANNKNLTIIREFRETESAKSSGREVFNEMLQFVKDRNIDHILVEKTDRLYRNLQDYILLAELGVNVHLVRSNKSIKVGDIDAFEDEFIHEIELVIAKRFIGNLRKETRKGMLEKARQGGLPHLAPIGYINDTSNHTIVVDPDRAPFVKKAFELYSTGHYSLSSLTDKLNRDGFRSKKGRKISKRGMQTILRNPIYYGWFRWSGQLWKGSHDPLVAKELFDKAQSVLERKHVSGKKGKWFAFKGLLTCGYCGHSITAEIQKGHVYYSCANPKKCGQGYHREEKISKMFADELGKFYLDDKIREWTRKALKKSHEKEELLVKSELQRLQREYSRYETRLHQVYDDKLNGLIAEDFFKEKQSQIQERQQEIHADIERLQRINRDYIDDGAKILELMQHLENTYLRANIEQRSNLVHILCSNLELKGVNSTFHWNKPFDILYKLGKNGKWGE